MLYDKLEEAIRSGPRVVAKYFDGKGHTHIIRKDEDDLDSGLASD
jgi:hypothetical protein